MTDISQLGNVIAQYAAEKNKDYERTMRAAAVSLFSGVIKGTRVDEGRLRNNWFCTIGTPSQQATDVKSKTGAFRIANMTEIARGWDLAAPIYLTNNLPYARKIDRMDSNVIRNLARVENNIRRKTELGS